MKYVILSLAIFLSACSTTVPVTQKFPEAPKELLKKCPTLNIVEPGETAITDFLKTVVKNYELYYECSIKQEGWTDWYNEQKQNFNKANKNE